MQQKTVCSNCGIVIRWQPTLVDGRAYCCLGCAEGGPCACDYDNLPEPGEVKAMVRCLTDYLPSPDMAGAGSGTAKGEGRRLET